MSLFELADDDGQRHPLEVADRGGRPYLRLRKGTMVTETLVVELNDLLGAARAEDHNTARAWSGVASIPILRGLVHVGVWQPPTVTDHRWVTVSFVGDDLRDTADLTVGAALALSDTLRTAALR